MKKILILLSLIALVAVAQHTQAQKQYPYSYRVTSTLTSGTTIAITPAATLTYYKLTATHAPTVNATTTKAVLGDIAAFQVTASGANRIIAWGADLDGLNDTVASGKTKVFLFIWNGTAFKKCSAAATD